MSEGERRPRLQSFLLGSLMGGLAGFAASRLGALKAGGRAVGSHGDLRPFEAAPCFQEAVEARTESRERPRHGSGSAC
jgi:hypothetical protein